jgi:electron transfer flavoprotein-quinone oxidoreductase
VAQKDFDVIIVGAGVAGSACASILAGLNKKVLLVERGTSPGTKNVTGGKLYAYVLEELGLGQLREVPLERLIRDERIIIGQGDQLSIVSFEDLPAYTVLRANFDNWLAKKAVESGAMLINGIRVDRLLDDGARVVGIQAGRDEIYCDVVVAADGINSQLAMKQGLRQEIRSGDIRVGVKETIELTPDIINSRFGLEAEEGTARFFLDHTDRQVTWTFLYTNRRSVSLGMLLPTESMKQQHMHPHEFLQRAKNHPVIRPLIRDGKTVEYAAHLVAADTFEFGRMAQSHEGLLVIGGAAGLEMNRGYKVHGMDLAIMSGIAAARAIVGEEDKGSLGEVYQVRLEGMIAPIFEKAQREHAICWETAPATSLGSRRPTGTSTVKASDLLFLDSFKLDETHAHIVLNPEACAQCVDKPCVAACPAGLYVHEDDGQISFDYSGCLECGTCRVVCTFGGIIEWSYPRGSFGIAYRNG